MRKLLIAIAAISLISSAATAADKGFIDMDKVCKTGCAILIEFSGQARFDETQKAFVGEFKETAKSNPMSYFKSLLVHGGGSTYYKLVSEPGKPMFGSIEDVQTYMNGHDQMLRNAKKTPAS